jgi:hypothetical protein
VIRFLAPTLLMFPLLSGIPTNAATAATNEPFGILQSHGLNQTENGAIVKVAEWCGNGYFKDEYGQCRPWYGNPHDDCPPGRHFVPWVYHRGGRCVPNY